MKMIQKAVIPKSTGSIKAIIPVFVRLKRYFVLSFLMLIV